MDRRTLLKGLLIPLALLVSPVMGAGKKPFNTPTMPKLRKTTRKKPALRTVYIDTTTGEASNFLRPGMHYCVGVSAEDDKLVHVCVLLGNMVDERMLGWCYLPAVERTANDWEPVGYSHLYIYAPGSAAKGGYLVLTLNENRQIVTARCFGPDQYYAESLKHELLYSAKRERDRLTSWYHPYA